MVKTMLSAAAVMSLASVAWAAPDTQAKQFFQQGRWEEAAKAYQDLADEAPQTQKYWYSLGYALHALGRYEQALSAHEKAANLTGPATATAAYNAACASSLLGRAESAGKWISKAVSSGFQALTNLDTDPDLDAVRDDAGFLAVRNPLAARTVFRSFRQPAEKGHRDQFDFWIGDWETVNFSATPTGGWTRAGALESRVYEVLGGHALVEWSASTAPGGPTQGFSIRTFDPGRNEWLALLNWPSKDNPSLSFLSGQFRHGRCELVTPLYGAGGSSQTRFTFADAGPDRYRWDSASTTNGGKSWSCTLMFEGRRRKGAPLTTGPSRTNDHCAGEAFRQLDFLLGAWSGTRTVHAPGGAARELPVRLHCYSVMEGSAIVEEETVGKGESRRESFAIECFEPTRARWVRYSIDDRTPRFRRHEGVVRDGAVKLLPARGPGSSGAPATLVVSRKDVEGARRLHQAWRKGDTTLWEQTLAPAE